MNRQAAIALPLPIDDVQRVHLEIISRDGFSIASPGTLRYQEMANLVDQGLLQERCCRKAMGVYQFEITAAGREAIA